MSSESSGVAVMVLENHEFIMILMMSIAVLIMCIVVLIWRRSDQKPSKTLEPLKSLIVKDPEIEVDDGKQKVTIFSEIDPTNVGCQEHNACYRKTWNMQRE